MKHLCKTVAAAALAMGSVGGHAQTLTNGNFETYQGAPGPASIRNFVAGTDVTGWTSTGTGTIYESAPNDGIAAAGDGTHWVSFGHNSARGASLGQLLNTVLGTIYTVNYLIRQQQGMDDRQFFTVGIDGGFSVASGTPTLGSWTAGKPLTFTGTGGALTLRFTDATPAGAGGSANLALDAVSLNAIALPAGAVPEPATWAMMIAGFGLVGFAMRRQPRQALAPAIA